MSARTVVRGLAGASIFVGSALGTFLAAYNVEVWRMNRNRARYGQVTS